MWHIRSCALLACELAWPASAHVHRVLAQLRQYAWACSAVSPIVVSSILGSPEHFSSGSHHRSRVCRWRSSRSEASTRLRREAHRSHTSRAACSLAVGPGNAACLAICSGFRHTSNLEASVSIHATGERATSRQPTAIADPLSGAPTSRTDRSLHIPSVIRPACPGPRSCLRSRPLHVAAPASACLSLCGKRFRQIGRLAPGRLRRIRRRRRSSGGRSCVCAWARVGGSGGKGRSPRNRQDSVGQQPGYHTKQQYLWRACSARHSG